MHEWDCSCCMLKSEHHQEMEGISAHQLWAIRKCIIKCAYSKEATRTGRTASVPPQRHFTAKVIMHPHKEWEIIYYTCSFLSSGTSLSVDLYIEYRAPFIHDQKILKIDMHFHVIVQFIHFFLLFFIPPFVYWFAFFVVVFNFGFDFVFLCVASTFGMGDDWCYFYFIHFLYTNCVIATKCAVNSMYMCLIVSTKPWKLFYTTIQRFEDCVSAFCMCVSGGAYYVCTISSVPHDCSLICRLIHHHRHAVHAYKQA